MTTVTSELIGPLKRFARSQAAGPIVSRGGGSVSAVTPLQHLDAAVVEVHEEAGEEADREVRAHDEDDDRHRLAGLVRHRLADLEEVGVADGDRQARVLRQVQVLAGEGRDDDPQRLRKDDEPQRLALAEAEGASRLDLALSHRLDAAAHDLTDEGGGIEHQPDEQRGELRREAHAAGEVEALAHGDVERDRRGGDPSQRGDRQQGQPAERAQPANRPPGVLAGARDAADDDEHHDADRDEGQPGQEPRRDLRRGQEDAALADEDRAWQGDRLGNRRQRQEDREVEDEELNEERRIADDLDVPRGDAPDEPVRRQSRHADDDPEDRGQDDAQHADDEGVEQPDQERAGVRVARGVGDPGLADVEPGAAGQEAEAEPEPAFGGRGHEIGDHQRRDGDDDEHHEGLRREAQHADISPRRHAGRAGRVGRRRHRSWWGSAGAGRSRPRALRSYRNGGA